MKIITTILVTTSLLITISSAFTTPYPSSSQHSEHNTAVNRSSTQHSRPKTALYHSSAQQSKPQTATNRFSTRHSKFTTAAYPSSIRRWESKTTLSPSLSQPSKPTTASSTSSILHSPPNPTICASSLLRLGIDIGELITHTTESGIFMAEAQTLNLDRELQCNTTNGILTSGAQASVECKKNQELKFVISQLKFTPPEAKLPGLKRLNAVYYELAEVLGCYTKKVESSQSSTSPSSSRPSNAIALIASALAAGASRLAAAATGQQ